MSARSIQLADAVVALLNGHAFSQAFVAVRAWRPVTDLKSVTALQVHVLPTALETSQASRTRVQDAQQIDVEILRKVEQPDDLPALDAMVALAEEIGDFLRQNPPVVAPAARALGFELFPGNGHLAPKLLDELHLFGSVVRLSYASFHS